jgi:two-component system, NarL family, response regulator NreC
VKIVLAEELRMVRECFRAVLESAGFQVIGEAANGHEAIDQARRLRPDVVVMGIAMPELNGVDATRQLTAEVPGIRVLALSKHADRRSVIAMLEAGAAGYLLKTSAVEDLLIALTIVARGETYLSPTIARDVVDTAIHVRSAADHGERSLSSREREVLQLIAEGKSSKDIATVLHIALPTVQSHRHQVMEKLNLRSVAELTKYAIREGLTSNDR